MSKKHLTLSDLKDRGLRLTKEEATELLPHITEISHRGLEDNYVFRGPEEVNEEDSDDVDDHQEEKLIWEYKAGEQGWCVLGTENIDDDGNLKGAALEHFEFMKSQPDAERGDCSSYWFRQTSESEIGKGDSTGNVKILLSVGLDDDDLDTPVDDSTLLSEEQEANLMATIGITTENTPEEYLNALYAFIGDIPDEVPPKLLKKLTQLQELITPPPSQINSTNADSTENGDGKKEHYATKRKRLKDAGLMEYSITQEDVDNAKYAGAAGDVIEIPIPVAE